MAKKQKSEYEIQAEKFLEKFNLAVSFKLLDKNVPKWEEHNQPHNHYKIIVSRKTSYAKPLSFQWWDSIDSTEKNIKPSAYDALTTLSSESYTYSSFEDFASEFGYDIDSRKALRTYKEVQILAARINSFFTIEEIEGLREIQ
jgi:hypothetical protein